VDGLRRGPKKETAAPAIFSRRDTQEGDELRRPKKEVEEVEEAEEIEELEAMEDTSTGSVPDQLTHCIGVGKTALSFRSPGMVRR
jgi:hypothetical protein